MPVETFHQQIARNKRNTVILIAGFAVVFVALGLAIGLVWGGYRGPDAEANRGSSRQLSSGLNYRDQDTPLDEDVETVEQDISGWQGLNWPFAWTVAGIAAGVAFVLTLGSFYGGSSVLLSMSRAREIRKEDDPQLFNVVEEMAIAGGVPMPRVFLIDDSSMNAFATGRNPQNAAVAITTGLREKLTRDQLQGVMAHEMSHVRHYDILYATLMAVLVGTVVLLSDIFLRSLWFGAGSRRRRDSDSNGGAAQAILLVIAIVLAILAPILAMIIQMAMSRQREYLADAGAVELTRNPEGLAGALERLGGDTEVLEAASRATAPMYIVQPVMAARSGPKKAGLFDTHPPLTARIERLRSLQA